MLTNSCYNSSVIRAYLNQIKVTVFVVHVVETPKTVSIFKKVRLPY